jgi:hypothetical protein
VPEQENVEPDHAKYRDYYRAQDEASTHQTDHNRRDADQADAGGEARDAGTFVHRCGEHSRNDDQVSGENKDIPHGLPLAYE